MEIDKILKFYKNVVVIKDCYKLTLSNIRYIVNEIKEDPECPTSLLPIKNEILENLIISHKVLYLLKYEQDRTRDCDLNVESEWSTLGYNIIGSLYRVYDYIKFLFI